MRESSLLAGALSVLLSLGLACSGTESAESPAPDARPQPRAAADPMTEPASRSPTESARAQDPERAAKLADLDDLCAAVDHDYIDGTLSSYYAKLEMRTSWGQAQRSAGEASMRPGRLLEGAVAELSPGMIVAELSHCATLLDYLDDVE